MNKVAILLGAVFLVTGCTKKSGNLTLLTSKSKVSYAIGQQIGREIKGQNFDIDPDVLAMSIGDVLEGKESRLSVDEMRKVMQEAGEKARAERQKQAGANKEKGAKFLAENKKKKGIKTTKSGLQYEILEEGKGPKPKATDVVKVHYKGVLTNGEEFDSSYKRKEPAEFPLNGVIRGWTEGLQLMKKGGKAKFYIPSDLAYGPMGRPGIPPNSVLIFDIELLDIKKRTKK